MSKKKRWRLIDVGTRFVMNGKIPIKYIEWRKGNKGTIIEVTVILGYYRVRLDSGEKGLLLSDEFELIP